MSRFLPFSIFFNKTSHVGTISNHVHFISFFSPWVLLLFGCSANQNHNSATQEARSSYVNPFIGTSGHGHTFPGAALPFGMVQLSPDTGVEDWDWCSGYHYSDSSIMGFSHTHFSGTGRGDLLDVLLMPTVGRLHTKPGRKGSSENGYRSKFDHKDEIASPGYYAVKLKDHNIYAELTCTNRVGFHKYTFPKTDSAHIIIDLAHGRVNDTVTHASIRFVDNQTIVGQRFSKGWGEPGEDYFIKQKVFFAATFSKQFKGRGIVADNAVISTVDSVTAQSIQAFVDFNTDEGEEIFVKVAISSVDEQGALHNLQSEIDHWDFNKVKSEAENAWEKQLSHISIIDTSRVKKEIFYTALYHSFLGPYLYMDVDGRYRGSDDSVRTANGFTNYTFFSLWDTFRAAHPLFTLLQPDRVNDLINSMLAQYHEYGLLPVWSMYSSETNCMIGYHAVPVIVDAYFKGIRNFDVDVAYTAMKKSAMQNDFGINYLKQYNYIPSDLHNKSVSKTLEYAFDDWCIARMAKDLGYDEDYQYFTKRSKAYANVFDKQTLFMRGKNANGKFADGFDPTFASYGKSDFIEGNSWQYSWFVPHDIDGLIELMGGKEVFDKKLDDLFSERLLITEDAPTDISGLIGQYAHGNEPSHHVAYLYNYAGQPSKTQEKVDEIMGTLYSNKPDGLCGNEDAGQMSAWYVLSAFGFYPVNPASGEYSIGKPLFRQTDLTLANGNVFSIRAPNLTDENRYVKSVRLNGVKIENYTITHSQIINGGELVFDMTNTKN